MRINLLPFSGRVGTTSIALALANNMAKREVNVDLVCSEHYQVTQLLHYAGMLISDNMQLTGSYKRIIPTEYAFTIRTEEQPLNGYSVGIYGNDVHSRAKHALATDAFTYNIALISTTYSSIASIVQTSLDNLIDGYILNVIPGAALTPSDCENVLQKPCIAQWEFDLAFQRRIDAGMFLQRNDQLLEMTTEILDRAFAKAKHKMGFGG
jgi:hypothetical protein